MRRIPFFLVAVVMLFTLASISSAQDRTFGARRFLLDDGTNTVSGLVYLTDNNGSLGVDLNGNVSGTFPSPCAILDLSSTTKGFLPPRMTGLQESNICGGAPPLGLLVYNTSSNTLDLFSTTGWSPILGGMSWLLGGNNIVVGGTGPGQSFIGTNDVQDFVIATDGTERARFIGVAGPNQGFFGINTTTPGSLLDVNGTFNSTGNSTVGSGSGTTNTFGNFGGNNNAIGNGGGGTINTIGNSATQNEFGDGGAVWNRFGSNESGLYNEFGDYSGLNYFGYQTPDNEFGTGGAGINDIGSSGVTTNNVFGPTNINTITGDATAIGSTSNGSGVTIASNNATAITLNVSNTANNLVFNNIAAGSNTDAALLDLTAIPSGNVRTRTIGSLITGSQGVEVSYTGSSADAHFAPNNVSATFLSDRGINTGNFILHITGNSGGPGVTYATFNGVNDAVGINNVAPNSGSTTIGNTSVGGIVSINSSISTSRTSPTNTLTATTTTNTITAATQNSITGGTGNTITASTGNNAINATVAQNTITGQTGNSMTATTGNNVIATSAPAAQNNLNANGLGGTNNLNANTATGQNNLTANAGGSNNIVGATNINNGFNASTNITTSGSNGTTTIGNSAAGAISLTSNAATAISLNVNNIANNLQLANINAGSSTDAAFLDLTATPTGNVRTRTIGTIITGSQGVEVTYSGSSADAHFAASSASVPFGSARYINTGGNILHITNSGATDFLSFNGGNNAVNINNSTVGNNNIGNGGGTTSNVFGNSANNNTWGVSATFNDFGQNGTTNWFGLNAPENLLGFDASTNYIVGTTNINTGTGPGGSYHLTTIGNGAGTSTQLTVNGSVGGLVGAAPYSNGPNNGWDLYVAGDAQVTGILKLGTASMIADASTNSLTGYNGNGLNLVGAAGPVTINAVGGGNVNVSGNILMNVSSALSTTIGNFGSSQHLIVNGSVDALSSDVAGNSHWDVQVTGDQLVTGTMKVGTLVLTPFTPGSVIFAGASGQLSQDVTVGGQLFWDAVNHRLGIGTNAPGWPLDVVGVSNFQGLVQANNGIKVLAGGLTVNGGATINNGATINAGTTLNNGTTMNNLVGATDDFAMTTAANSGGVVNTRQISTLPFVGGVVPVTAQGLAVAYNVAAADYLILCTNGAAGNVNLPNAVGSSGKIYVVKRTNAAVTVGTNGGNIDGAANFPMNNANQVAAFASDGANWFVVSN